MTELTVAAIVTAALIDSLNPCAVGVMLMLVALMFSLYRQTKILKLLALGYVAGVFLAYLFIGLGILKAVHLFGVHGFFGYVSAVILIIFGLIHLNLPLLKDTALARFIQRCRIPKDWRAWARRGTVLAVFFLGVLVGICEFPCTGGIYLGVLALLANTTSFWPGLGWLLLYNLIFVSPLILILLFTGNKLFLQRLEGWYKRGAAVTNKVMGWVMFIAGVALLYWLLI